MTRARPRHLLFTGLLSLTAAAGLLAQAPGRQDTADLSDAAVKTAVVVTGG